MLEEGSVLEELVVSCASPQPVLEELMVDCASPHLKQNLSALVIFSPQCCYGRHVDCLCFGIPIFFYFEN